jgi:hypothetical protein
VLPTGRNVCFGWFIETELYAVAVYGDGINQIQHRYLARLTGLPVKRGNLFELRRLFRSEPPRESFPLSQFIAGSHRILKRDHGIRFIVSFSDPAHNGFKKRCRDVAYAKRCAIFFGPGDGSSSEIPLSSKINWLASAGKTSDIQP